MTRAIIELNFTAIEKKSHVRA